MRRIVVVSPSPLLADGLAAALRVVVDWDVHIGRAEDAADAWVLPSDEIVVRGAQGASAHLAAGASASRLRAAVGAVLEGLCVRESPWFADAPEHEPLTPRELEVFEPRHRRGARHFGSHGEVPRRADPREGRRGDAGRGGARRVAVRVDRAVNGVARFATPPPARRQSRST
jgi:hypothetical protein